MAKVKFSALISEMRNKLNGSVFSKNRGGNYLRNKVTPVNPNTSFQAAARSLLTGFAQAWRGLLQSEILAWNNAVQDFKKTDIFGDIKTPSGINLFNRLNINLANVGQAMITMPPLPTEVVPTGALTVAAAAGAGTVSINNGGAGTGAATAWLIEATSPQSPGKNFVKSEFRVIGYTIANAATPTAQGGNYTTKFGGMVAGQKIFIRCTPIEVNTGIAGIPQIASAIIAV